MSNHEKYLIIPEPNSCTQGFNPHHAENPHHAILTRYGWKYSHTTPINGPGGKRYASHTYKFPGADWNIGVECHPHFQFFIRSSRGGSGTESCLVAATLENYLKRKTAELKRAVRMVRIANQENIGLTNAAPDLLAACKAALSMLRDCNPQDPELIDLPCCPRNHPNCCGACSVRYLLEDAIAKAENPR